LPELPSLVAERAVPKITLDQAGIVGFAGAFFVLAYVARGALPAGLQTIVVAISLLIILRLGGGGKWKAAFRSLVERPWDLVFIGILFALYLRRLLDDVSWSIILDIVLALSFLWAFTCVGSRFQSYVLKRPHDEKSGPGRAS
jgi:hypothetical protein